MNVTVRAAQLSAQDIQLGDLFTLQEVRLSGQNLRMSLPPDGLWRIETVEATLIVTEASLNRFLASRAEEPIRDMQVALLAGRVRISGRYRVGFVPVPFSLTAVPEIEGGARLRLEPQQMSLLVPLPGVGAQMVGEIINARLRQQLDVSNLPLPGVRLTGLVVEPGRLLLTATASLELRPAATDLTKRE